MINNIRKPVVLVADDDPDIRDIVQISLETKGIEVRTASDGIETLDAIGRCEFDLLVLDVDMPGLNGYSVVQELRGNERTATIPVILASGLMADSKRSESDWAKELGVERVFIKPFDVIRIVEAVETILSSRPEK